MKGLGQVGLAVVVPLSLGFTGFAVSNRDKTNRLDDVFKKVSSEIDKNNLEIKKIKMIENSFIPRRFLDLSVNRNFLEHLLERERINKCNFKISMEGGNEMKEIEQIIEPRTEVDKKFQQDMKNTTWDNVRRDAIDSACMKFREVRITKRPSTKLGWSQWAIVGLDDKGVKQPAYHIWHYQK